VNTTAFDVKLSAKSSDTRRMWQFPSKEEE